MLKWLKSRWRKWFPRYVVTLWINGKIFVRMDLEEFKTLCDFEGGIVKFKFYGQHRGDEIVLVLSKVDR